MRDTPIYHKQWDMRYRFSIFKNGGKQLWKEHPKFYTDILYKAMRFIATNHSLLCDVKILLLLFFKEIHLIPMERGSYANECEKLPK